VSKTESPRFAVCMDERHEIYRVLRDEQTEAEGDLRVVDSPAETVRMLDPSFAKRLTRAS